MDSVRMFPYCLERSTNVKKRKLAEVECPELIQALKEYICAIERLQIVASERIKKLEQEYSLCQNPNILKAKRKMLTNKSVTNQNQFKGTEVESIISEYNMQVEETARLGEKYKQLFAECTKKNRIAMQRFFGENENVLRTLPLINKDFIYKLKKYLEVPVEEHNAKIRKLDHQLIRLFTRATMKTSPFSFLTSTCLYDIEKEARCCTRGELRSICDINNYIIKAIYDFIVQKPYFATQIEYRLNAHKEYGEYYIFLYQKDYEKGKVYKTVDGTVKINKSGIFELVVNQFEDRIFHFEELLKLFIDNGMQSEKVVDFIYSKLILNNIITPHKTIDDTKENIFQEFYAKIALLSDDENRTLEEVLHAIEKYEEQIKEFESADWQKRFAIVNTLDGLVSEIESVLNRKFVHNILLYEDSVYDKPKKPVYIQELKKYNLNKLQKYCRIFDQSVMTYVLFSEMFHEKYGKCRIAASDLDVYKLFVEASSKLTNVWKDNFSIISIDTIDKITKIADLKREMYTLIQSKKRKYSPQDIKAFIDDAIEENQDIFDADIDSATFFFQKTGDGELVINKVYKGQLIFFTRFLKMFSQDLERIQDYCQYAFGPNPLEITESFGFNANVHNQIFDKRLVLNLTDQNDATNKDVSINDCYFFYDSEKKLVKLGNDSLGEANGIYFGSLAYNLMPILLRTINGMQPTTRFDSSYLNLWNRENQEDLVADHIPRICYGNVVIMREQYLINSIYDLKKTAEELYIEIIEDFQRAELPLRFFIRPYINGADFDFYNMRRTSLKPQYIDLSSPLLFREMLREMENQKQFVLEEIYPDNPNDEYIFEYEIEQTLYR